VNEKLFRQLDALAEMNGLEAAYEAAIVIAQKASELAPRDTGYLADNIHAEMTPEGGVVISEAPYTEHVEFGTSRMAAQPFLRPAMDEYQAEINKAAKRGADREVARRIG
jgi:HK97 gp10 family phage protein